MTDAQTDPLSLPFRTQSLSPKKPTRFALTPDLAVRTAVAQSLGITAVHALTFKGEMRPVGRRDVLLEGTLVARVEQPCGISLAPVVTDISEPVTRRYIADWQDPTGDEVEMPDDDTTDPLPEVIDVGVVAVEALSLALPLYPRAPGVALGEAVFAAPDAVPLRDGDLKPFAGLASLKAKLQGDA
jgi:uncharacterized metal-binding protein YceD (DUF177 family)